MGEAAEKIVYSYAEYLAAEEKSDVKHEWLNGEIIEMPRGIGEPMRPGEHARLAASLIQHLANALKGKPCKVYSSDLRVKVEETGLCTYPDVSVACGHVETAADDRHALINPIVLVEVLSESSEAYDRGEKFSHYRRIPSLQEYVLVSQKSKRLEVFRRGPDGGWILFDARPGESLVLASLGVSISVDEVYFDPMAGK